MTKGMRQAEYSRAAACPHTFALFFYKQNGGFKTMSNATAYQRLGNRSASQSDASTRPSRKNKNSRRIPLLALVLLLAGAVLATTNLFIEPTPVHAQNIPTNASGGCPVAAATFNSWFQTLPVAANGVVNPANSLTFAPTSLCSFYQW